MIQALVSRGQALAEVHGGEELVEWSQAFAKFISIAEKGIQAKEEEKKKRKKKKEPKSAKKEPKSAKKKKKSKGEKLVL